MSFWINLLWFTTLWGLACWGACLLLRDRFPKQQRWLLRVALVALPLLAGASLINSDSAWLTFEDPASFTQWDETASAAIGARLLQEAAEPVPTPAVPGVAESGAPQFENESGFGGSNLRPSLEANRVRGGLSEWVPGMAQGAPVTREEVSAAIPRDEVASRTEFERRDRKSHVRVEPLAKDSLLPAIGGDPQRWEDLVDDEAWLSPVATSASPRPGAGITRLYLEEPLFMLWCAGVLYGLVRLLLSARGVRLFLAAATPVAPSIRRRLRQMARTQGCSRDIRVLHHPTLTQPVACGWKCPTLVLPSNWQQPFVKGQLDPLIQHEIAHLRSRDPGWRLLYWGVAIIFWPQPFLWVLRRREQELSELAADMAVVEHGTPQQRYVELLGAIALGGSLPGSPMIAALFGGRHPLERRIRMIRRGVRHGLRQRLASHGLVAGLGVGLTALCMLVVANPLVGFATPQQGSGNVPLSSDQEPELAPLASLPPAPECVPAPDDATPAASPAAAPLVSDPIAAYRDTYVVRMGDSLSAIADRFGVSSERIRELNPDCDLSRLAVGQHLQLPQLPSPRRVAEALDKALSRGRYQQAVEEYQQLARDRAVAAELAAQGQLQRQQADSARALVKIESELAAMTADLQRMTDLHRVMTQKGQSQSAMNEVEERIDRLSTELATLKERAEMLQGAQGNARLGNRVHSAQGTLGLLEGQDLDAQRGRYADFGGRIPNSPRPNLPGLHDPHSQARVGTLISLQPDSRVIFECSEGTSFRVGEKLRVLRDGAPVAEVAVAEIFSGFGVAKVLSAKAQPREGDEVYRQPVEPQVARPWNGIVLAVRDHLVVINSGSNDGVRDGDSVVIFRGDRFIATATVSRCSGDLCGATVEVASGVIQPGDSVYSGSPQARAPQPHDLATARMRVELERAHADLQAARDELERSRQELQVQRELFEREKERWNRQRQGQSPPDDRGGR